LSWACWSRCLVTGVFGVWWGMWLKSWRLSLGKMGIGWRGWCTMGKGLR